MVKIRIENILLDWTGTTADVVGYLYNIDMEIFDQFNVPRISREEFQKNSKFGPNEDYMTLFKIYGITARNKVDELSKKAGLKIPPNAPVFPETYDVLKQLKENRITIDILSTGGIEGNELGIASKLQEINARQYICDIIIAKKGKAEIIKNMINSGQINASTTAIVGDRAKDIRAGKENSIYTIAALYGMDTPKKLMAEKPDNIIYKLSDLPQMIKELRSNDRHYNSG